MKFSSFAGLLAIPALLVGCNSLDNPLHGLLGSGNDGRVFNARTGNYEWPADQNKPPVKSQKTAQIGAAIAAAATPAPASDGRVYDAQKREWVDAPTPYEGPKSGKPKPKPAAKPAPGATPAPVVLAAAPPQPPRPQRATGVYDPHTGKIEWQDGGGGTMPAPTPVPESKKHWYWPF